MSHGGDRPEGRAPVVVLEHVSRRYDDLAAVWDLSLSLGEGEILCLLGPSGCGKTTTLRMVAGVERPDRGRIFIDGAEVDGESCFVPPERRNIGLMFQDHALFPHMSVAENVAFGLAGMSAGGRRERALRELERVDMRMAADFYPDRLSGGEQQRVALARALAPGPGVMLMDEPFSGLDRRLRDSVRDQTLTLLKSIGACALLVTHDPEEAMRMGDRIALMRRGRLLQLGSPEDMYYRPVDAEVAFFFSDFNEMQGVVEGGAIAVPFARIASGKRFSEGQKVCVLVRQEAFRLQADRAGCLPVRARVWRARLLGSDSLIECRLREGGALFRARLPGIILPAEGEELRLHFDPAHILVFAQRP